MYRHTDTGSWWPLLFSYPIKHRVRRQTKVYYIKYMYSTFSLHQGFFRGFYAMNKMHKNWWEKNLFAWLQKQVSYYRAHHFSTPYGPLTMFQNLLVVVETTAGTQVPIEVPIIWLQIINLLTSYDAYSSVSSLCNKMPNQKITSNLAISDLPN